MEWKRKQQRHHKKKPFNKGTAKKYAISGSLKSCFKHTEANKKNTIKLERERESVQRKKAKKKVCVKLRMMESEREREETCVCTWSVESSAME